MATHFPKKGISPLIAAVLLVAFTMAIAGIMAAWATTFAQGQLTQSSSCALALRITDLKFVNGNVTLRIVNENTNSNLTGIKFSLVYADGSKDINNALLKSYNPNADPLQPGDRQTIIINTTDNVTEPVKIVVIAGNCPKAPADQRFVDFR